MSLTPKTEVGKWVSLTCVPSVATLVAGTSVSKDSDDRILSGV